ncbi:MAG: hypothetical protein A3F10_04185 [Coxiella sp. RIFCSPHIGHO2_12_FULL_42_15]|nr:MAG: hypothetical protein A3F10_04185 [Coxiella sp. RIFCSPHIGHO2_12_FULL_42_15]
MHNIKWRRQLAVYRELSKGFCLRNKGGLCAVMLLLLVWRIFVNKTTINSAQPQAPSDFTYTLF